MKRISLREAATALVLLGLVLLQGCGSSSSRYLSPEYERGSSQGATITILPLSSDVLPDSVAEMEIEAGTQNTHFNREGRNLYYELFDLELQDVAAAQVRGLERGFKPTTMLSRRRLPIGSSDTLSIPVPEGAVAVSGETADFVLLVDNLRFRSLSKQVREGAMGSAKRTTEIHLIATCRYLLWDNRRARPAAYGRYKGNTRVRSPTSERHYVNLYEDLADHVIERSPIPVALSGVDGRSP